MRGRVDRDVEPRVVAGKAAQLEPAEGGVEHRLDESSPTWTIRPAPTRCSVPAPSTGSPALDSTARRSVSSGCIRASRDGSRGPSTTVPPAVANSTSLRCTSAAMNSNELTTIALNRRQRSSASAVSEIRYARPVAFRPSYARANHSAFAVWIGSSNPSGDSDTVMNVGYSEKPLGVSRKSPGKPTSTLAASSRS